MPVPDCNLFLVEEDKVQYGWPVVVDWVGGGCVGVISETKICCIGDVDYVLGALGGLAAGLPSGVVLVHVACN